MVSLGSVLVTAAQVTRTLGARCHSGASVGQKEKTLVVWFQRWCGGISSWVPLLKIGGLLSDELSTVDKSQFQENHLCSTWLCVPGGLCVLSFAVRQSAWCFGFARLRCFLAGASGSLRGSNIAPSRPRGADFSEFRGAFSQLFLSWKCGAASPSAA